jgi:hypothetical protein
LLFSCLSRIHRNHSAAVTTVQPPFSTIRCKALNNFSKVCYSLPDVAAMTPRRPRASFSDVPPIPCRGCRSPSTFLTSLPHYFYASSFLSSLAATLMDLPASVANKRLTAKLNPLAATLTKNTGAPPTSQMPFSSLQAWGRSDAPFASRMELRDLFPTYPLSFHTLAHSFARSKTQLFSFQAIPHSLPKTTGRGGTCANHWQL